MIPVTAIGQFIGIIAMLFGVLFLSMPLAIIGNNFCEVWNDKARVVLLYKLQSTLLMNGITVKNLLQIFQDFDKDQSGTIRYGLPTVFIIEQTLICAILALSCLHLSLTLCAMIIILNPVVSTSFAMSWSLFLASISRHTS
jgi:hypothetical protein